MKRTKRLKPRKMKTPNDATTKKLVRAQQRRAALREALFRAKMTAPEVARAAGLPGPNSIYNFLSGRSQTLSQSTLEKLAEVIPGTTLASLSGLESMDDGMASVRSIQVRAAAAAGLMQPAFDLPPRQQSQAFMPLSEGMHSAGAFGVVVRQPGAEKLFPDGTILACVPMHSYDGQIKDGDKVILQRIVGARVEVTVCEMEIQANEAWLWLRSTHPEHQTPTRMPYTPGQPPMPWRDGNTRLSLAAVVVGAYIPMV